MKTKEPDFSILNDTDIFFVETGGDRQWLFQGNNLYTSGEGIHLSLSSGEVYKGYRLSSKESITSIRKATLEEIEPYKKCFKKGYRLSQNNIYDF